MSEAISMLDVVIVDDEPAARRTLREFCEKEPDLRVVGEYGDGRAAVEALRANPPHLLFLDIEMPHMNGFDMLEQFDKLFFDVVFCTAYDQFAIRAFKYSALNYLLKPVDPEDLKETIRRIEEKKTAPSREQIDLLFQTIRQTARPTAQRIALTTADGLIFVPTSDVVYCQAESNYTSVILTGGKKIVVSKVLKDIDEA